MAEDRPADIELAETFGAVARVLLEELDVDRTLTRICRLAVDTLDACETAGISIVDRRGISSLSFVDDLPRVLDEIQSEVQEGPCIDAINEHEVFVTGALSRERRWPHFARRAHAETGVESILSLRLFASAGTMGALNLYSSQADAFDDNDIAVASVFAAHAAVALSAAQREAQLESKAGSRDVIGMAKGIIIARQNVSEEVAFDILRKASQRANVKLGELADRIVHPVPADPPAAPAEA